MWEVKKVYQPVQIKEVDLLSGKLEIVNKYFFSDLSSLQGSWKLVSDGQVLQSGALPGLTAAAGKGETITVTGTVAPGVQATVDLVYRNPEGFEMTRP
jgi:beta-galactosidase